MKEDDADRFMYFDCIKFVKQLKKGSPFGETSPVLSDISAVPTWERVTEGLFKMFLHDFFYNFKVMKNMKFGSLLEI